MIRYIVVTIFFFYSSKGFGQSAFKQKNFKAPYYDTLSRTYCINNEQKKTGLESKGYKNLSFFHLKNDVVFYLSGQSESVLIHENGNELYRGKYIIRDLLRVNGELFSIISDSVYVGSINIESCRVIDSLGIYNDFSYLNDRDLFFTNETKNEIYYRDLITNYGKKIPVAGNPKRIKNSGLKSPQLYYYIDSGSDKGLFDIKSGKEIIFGKIEYFLQINSKEIIYKDNDSGLVLININDLKQKRLAASEIYSVKNCKDKFILKTNNILTLVDLHLDIIPFSSSFSEIQRIGNMFAVKIDNKWIIVNKSGKQISQTSYDKIFQVNDFFIGKVSGEEVLKFIYPIKMHTFSLLGTGIYDYRDSLIIIEDKTQYCLWKLSVNDNKLIKCSSYPYLFTDSDSLFIFQNDRYGIVSIKGNVKTIRMYDFIVSVSKKYFFVTRYVNENLVYQYMIDSEGLEYIK